MNKQRKHIIQRLEAGLNVQKPKRTRKYIQSPAKKRRQLSRTLDRVETPGAPDMRGWKRGK